MMDAKKVDVLAVMDDLIELAHQCITFVPPEGPTCAEHLADYEDTSSRWLLAKEARNAMAELIEADREYDMAWQSITRHACAQREAAGLRRVRALDRIGAPA